jgi:hypothetical protein
MPTLTTLAASSPLSTYTGKTEERENPVACDASLQPGDPIYVIGKHTSLVDGGCVIVPG